MAGRILTLQRAARELGRLRTGYTDTTGSKPRPVRSAVWIVTSHSQDYIEAVAGEWGGSAEKWQPLGNGAQQWRVITETNAVDAILPPGGDPLSQSLELWSKGGCQRRCDGITEQISDTPCMCRAEHGDDFHVLAKGSVCSMTTRLNVMLPAMPDIGVWRAETHSYYAANELAGHVDVIRGLVGPNAAVPVRLRIEQRTRVADGKTKHFPVIALELRGITAGQVFGGTANLVQIGNAAPPAAAITREDRKAIGAGTSGAAAPDYPAQAKAATDLDAVRAIWHAADQAGHLTDDMREQLTTIGNTLARRGKPGTPMADIRNQVAADHAALREQIMAAAPPDWSVDDVEDDFAGANKGLVMDSADSEQLAAYLQQLIDTYGDDSADQTTTTGD